MTAAEFIGTLFLGRDVAHRVHLSTRSFAKHMALDAFYHAIVEHADKFAEAYQGRHGLISGIPLLSAKAGGNIIEFLQGQLDDIEKGREEVAGTDTALQNLIDETVATYLATLYKLKFLA